MKNNEMITVTYVVFVLFVFTSCQGNIPSAADIDVKNLVLEICTDELKNQLTFECHYV